MTMTRYTRSSRKLNIEPEEGVGGFMYLSLPLAFVLLGSVIGKVKKNELQPEINFFASAVHVLALMSFELESSDIEFWIRRIVNDVRTMHGRNPAH
jgi:hypothetical protein